MLNTVLRFPPVCLTPSNLSNIIFWLGKYRSWNVMQMFYWIVLFCTIFWQRHVIIDTWEQFVWFVYTKDNNVMSFCPVCFCLKKTAMQSSWHIFAGVFCSNIKQVFSFSLIKMHCMPYNTEKDYLKKHKSSLHCFL